MNIITKIKPRSNRYYGWQPDLPDHRDHRFIAKSIHGKATPLPQQVDLRPGFWDCYDQGELGSCTANALAGIHQFIHRKQNAPDITPSRLFIYYYERLILGTVGSDSGGQLRDGIQVLVKNGAPDESLWPYDIARFTIEPDAAAIAAAEMNQVLQYRRIDADIRSMQVCLAEGLPFVVGISIFESFESEVVAKSGFVPMPGTIEGSLGGHAIVCVGYDLITRMFLMRNSWGTDWGLNGYFWLPFAYLGSPDLADDRWAISQTE